MNLTLSLGCLATVHLLVAFLTYSYILITLGPGMETDAFFAGMAIPQFLLSVAMNSLPHVLVPLLSGENEVQIRKSAWGFLILVGCASASLAIFLSFSVYIWVPLLVPGFSQPGKVLAGELARIQLIGVVFAAVAGVLRAMYHARKRFLGSEIAQLLPSVLALGTLLWALPSYGVKAAAWVSAMREALCLLAMLPGLGGFCRPEWNHALVREARSRIGPLLLGNLYYKSGALVDRFLSSMTTPGGLSLLYFSEQIYGAGSQIVNRAIVAPVVPLLAEHAKLGDSGLFRHIYRKRLLGLGCVGLAVFVLLVSGGGPLGRLFRFYGDMKGENVELLSRIMLALVGFFIGGIMGQVLSSSFYAKGDVSTPLRVGVIGFSLGIALRVLGFLVLGLVGIAIGTSLHYMLNVLALYVLLERKIHPASSHGGA